MVQGFVIAMDGPVASGKGTIAPRLAAALAGFHLYTGAMYRSLALYCIEHDIEWTDKEKIIAVLPNVTVDLKDEKVLLNGVDVTDRIKDPHIAKGASPVAVIPEVRRYFVAAQQRIAENYLKNGRTVIAEGRDTATVAFPHAEIKIFLTATPEVRAFRRLAQQKVLGNTMSYEEVLQDTKERDVRDTTRDADPLSNNPEKDGYIVIDNSTLTESETLDAIIAEIKKKGLI